MNLTDDRNGVSGEDVLRYEKCSKMLDGLLDFALRSDDPQKGLNDLLASLGKTAGGTRTYIFQKESEELLSNTWEWCASYVESQKDFFQQMKVSDMQAWFNLFDQNETIYIQDLEQLRLQDPIIYSHLKPSGISSALIGRISDGHQLIGFVGIDDPESKMVPFLEPIMSQVGRIVGTQLMRIDTRRQMEEIDLRDPDTRLYNQHALYQHAVFDQNAESMGVVYGQVEQGLKVISRGYSKSAGELLSDMLETGRVYRINAREFVAVYVNIPESRINNMRRKIKFSTLAIKAKLRIGSAWSDESPVLDHLLQDSRRWSYLCGDDNQHTTAALDPLFRYLNRNHFDLGFLMKALTTENESGYFFFGDIQNNVYYVSDNMARKFGLNGNIIQDLPQFWSDRIKGKKAQQRFDTELQTMLEEKQDQLDIYHQVHTSEGHMEWVRCFAMAKWNPERTAPMFCAGRLMMQDVSLMVDCNTNFSGEAVLTRNLSKLREEDLGVRIIGFSLNDIAKVNNMQGRAFGDNLIRSVSEALENQMADRMTFYKLSGMRCAALIRSEFVEEFEHLIPEMRKIIEEKYHTYGIEVPNPCSFTVLDFPVEGVGTLDFVEDLNNCVKLSQQEITAPYLDSRALDIREIQQSDNMALELGRDVINQMSNFRLVIQPVVSSKTGEVVAGEALLRWRRDGKNVSPGQFIPILEHEKMIIPVGRWVLEESVKICRRIVSFKKDFHLSVNVSLQQLDDDGFLEFIRDTLKKYQLEGKHIFLEITESCMDKEQEKLMHFVNYCETLGIKVALDDFGTGYSSIRVLMQYPTAIIKLDRSLLLEMGKSRDKLNFISSIVFACHQFGKQVCIEGVETEEQCSMVKSADCDMIQGFYYFRPMEVDDIYRMLAKDGTIYAETFS